VNGSEIDARSDLFSLGIIMFTMLAGRKPFQGDTVSVMFKIVYEEPQLPSSLNPQLTPAHDYLIKKCLEKDRNQRYSSARELLNDLDDLQHGRPLRSQAVAPAPVPTSPAPVSQPDRTPAVPAPGLMKPTPQRPAPPTPPSAPLPQVAAQPPSPQAPRAVSAPPASPPPPAPPRKPVIPPPVKPATAPGARPLTGNTLVMQVPDLSSASTHPAPTPPPAPDFSPLERTLPMQRPDLSGASPQRPAAPHGAAAAPPAPRDFSRIEGTIQMPDSELTVTSPASGSPSSIPAPTLASDTRLAIEPKETVSAEMRPPRSKFIPILLVGVTVVLLAVGGIYWKFHHVIPAPVVTPQAAVQTPPVAPPPVVAPEAEAPPTPPPAEPVEQPTPPVSAPPWLQERPSDTSRNQWSRRNRPRRSQRRPNHSLSSLRHPPILRLPHPAPTTLPRLRPPNSPMLRGSSRSSAISA